MERRSTCQQVRLGALYIRKTRHFEKKDIAAAKILNIETIERTMHAAGSLADLQPDSIPPGPGILEVKETNRYLYIAHNDDLRPTVEQLKTGKAFELMANGFWSPRLQEITVQFTPSADLEGVNAGLWARRLIHDREPVFNWPMQKLAA